MADPADYGSRAGVVRSFPRRRAQEGRCNGTARCGDGIDGASPVPLLDLRSSFVRSIRIGLVAFVVLALTAVWPAVAGASPRPLHRDGNRGVVFVQTDGLDGNAVVAYDRDRDGALTAAGTFATGGVGGQLQGSVVDHLASQGSLSFDPGSRSLYAVNAGSNTVTVFGVRGDHLDRRQVVALGRHLPGERDDPRSTGVRAERARRRIGPGLRQRVRPTHPDPGIAPLVGTRCLGHPPVHQHAGPNRVLARRPSAPGHNEGERQRHRRVPRRSFRPAVSPHRRSTTIPARCPSRSPSIRRVEWSSARPGPTRSPRST